ncbi:MAG: hypothetical protein C0456_12205 [Hyphomonas sp.]|nr:hypothetical protein [Hyphomonas sp.]
MGQPTLTVVAGPNGSGKTTLSLELQLIQPANHLNADDFARLRHLQTGQALEDCERWAFAEVRRLQAGFIQAQRSHSYETVLSHPDHVRRALEAKRAGFHTRLIYIYLSNPDENVRRVASRFRSGGHNVPEDKIRARYARSLGLLRYAVASFDSALVMTNEGKSPDKALDLIASGGLVQCRSTLNRRIDEYSGSSDRWEDHGLFAGQSSGGWTEYCGDRSLLAQSKTELVHRRDGMLAGF